MPGRVDLSPHASVKQISLNVDNLACAYLANLYIPIFTLDTEKVLRRYEVPNQIAGIHFSYNKKNVIYAVDDSYGLHVFDVRSDTKKKFRLNPECENHNVICTALSTEEDLIAVASSTFGGGILDVRGSRRRENHEHVISLYDPRYPTDPVTTYHKRIKHGITSMEFYVGGNNIIVGDSSGAIKSFDTKLRDEDNAIRWEKWVAGPITKVGVINKRIVYGISDHAQASVFLDNKNTPLETLYGSVNDSAEEPIVTRSKAYFKKPEWCLGLIKGVTDDIPIVAVHGVEKKKFISLTAMNQLGVRQDAPLLSYKGHVGEVKCMKTTKELLLTGGEDGKVVVQIANFKNPKFGKDAIEHHRLTLNRGAIADSEENGDKSDEEDTEPETPSAAGPSTSEASSSKSKSSSSKTKSEKSEKSSSSSKSDHEKKEKKEDKKESKKDVKDESKDLEEKKKRKEEREKEKEKERERQARKEEKLKKAEKEKEKEKKKDRPSTSSGSSSKSESDKKKEKEKSKKKHEESEDDDGDSTREAAWRRKLEREKMPEGPMTDEQKKAYEEREQRMLAKMAETPEERAIRKQKAREEKRAAREEEERREKSKKQKREERDEGTPSKRSKTH